jgi:transposase InsO family protein
MWRYFRRSPHHVDLEPASGYPKGSVAKIIEGRIRAYAGYNQKWAGDISYIWTSEGWLYLAVILDLYSRRVIGWAVSNRMKKDLAIRALDMAVALRQPPEDCIHHTDSHTMVISYRQFDTNTI